jgi:hypothetical protein
VSRDMTTEVTTRRAKPPSGTELPIKAAGVLRAILAGNYGSRARETARAHKQLHGEPGTRYVGRLRHVLYREGADRAGDALSSATV